jgi:hypothetical protein
VITIQDWTQFQKTDEKEFIVLCEYLLEQRRIDLLIHAVDFRFKTASRNVEKSAIKSILKEASTVALSDYQTLQCQLRCELRKLLVQLVFKPTTPDLFEASMTCTITPTEPRIGFSQHHLLGEKSSEEHQADWLHITSRLPHTPGLFDMSIARPLLWKQAMLLLINCGSIHSSIECQVYYSYIMEEDWQSSPSQFQFYCNLYGKPYVHPSNCSRCSLDIHWIRKLEMRTSEFDISSDPRLSKRTFLRLVSGIFQSCISDGKVENIGSKMLMICLYTESILHELKTPDSGDWFLFDGMLRVYEFWFLPILNQTAPLEDQRIVRIARRLVYISGLRLRYARSDAESRRCASRFIFHLLQFSSLYLQQKETVLAVAQEVARKYLILAQEKGTLYEAFEISVFGLLVSREESEESNEFWYHLRKCLALHKSKLKATDTNNELPDLGPVYLSFKDSSPLRFEWKFWATIKGMILSNHTSSMKVTEATTVLPNYLGRGMRDLNESALVALGDIKIQQSLANNLLEYVGLWESTIVDVRQCDFGILEIFADFMEFCKSSTSWNTSFPRSSKLEAECIDDSRFLDDMFVQI